MNSKKEVQHVYLVGAKSLGAYGGYETFVYKLTEYHQNKENIKYHVACKANGDGCMDESKFEGVTKINDHEFEFHNAHCFKIDVPQIGSAQAIYYDVAALKACCEHIKKNHIPHPIVYIMACRIGPFAGHFYREIHKLGGTVYLNPDGHEWMRAKWSAPIRRYWKISEQMMVKYCDLAICDSVNIEKYIHECYDGKGIKGRNPKTTFIAYGADLILSKLADDDERLVNWYKEKGLTKKDYYLVVGRFVPENSFEVMIREFMKSKSQKDFAIITNVNDKFLNELEKKLHFKSDKRIKFVGTVYDQELLKKIRENAYAYFHGHTVGGTNPSLIEALGSTDLNLLVDVGFNKEVAEDCALYWSRKPGSLAKLIDKADQMSADEIAEMGRRAKKRVAEEYTFFEKHTGKEFVHFGSNEDARKRCQYYWLYQEALGSVANAGVSKKVCNKLRTLSIFVQRLIDIDRVKKYGICENVAVGSQWFSISDSLAHYVVSKEREILKCYKNTYCCDEVFLQTLVKNSSYKNNLYSYAVDDYHANMRDIDWKRGRPYTWRNTDFDELMESDYLFARKFDEQIDNQIIDRIYMRLKSK